MLLKLIVNGSQVSDLYVKNDLHVYHVFTLTVSGFKKSRNFVSIQRTRETNFIGSIIG